MTSTSGSSNNLRTSSPQPSPDDGGGSSGGSSDDTYDPSRYDALVDAVPDDITPENIERHLSALSHLPAADLASKLTPAAVSVDVIVMYTNNIQPGNQSIRLFHKPVHRNETEIDRKKTETAHMYNAT